MNKHFKQDRDVSHSSGVPTTGRPPRSWLRKAYHGGLRGLAALGLMAGLMAAAPAAQAYNVGLSSFQDSTSPWLMANGDPSGTNEGSNLTPLGGIVVYDAVVANIEASAVSDIAAVFDMAPGMTVYEIPSNCSSQTASSGALRIVCTFASLPALGTEAFQLKMATSGMVKSVVNVHGAVGLASQAPTLNESVQALDPATHPFFQGDSNISNNKLTDNTTLTDSADLELVKTSNPAAPGSVIGGGEVTYTLTVTNKGPGPASNFNVADSLPSGFTVVAGSFQGAGAGWAWNAATTTATHATGLAANATTTFSFKAKADISAGDVTNHALVTSVGTIDTQPNNNAAQADTRVRPGADLGVDIAWSKSPATTDQPLDLKITVTNKGPETVNDAVIKGSLPAGMPWNGADVSQAPGWACVPDVAGADPVLFTCTRQPGFSKSNTGEVITINTTAPTTPGDYTASATVDSALLEDPVATNDSDSATVSVLADGADLALGKSKVNLQSLTDPELAPNKVPAGNTVASDMLSRLTLHNNGPADVIGNAEIQELLAEGEEFKGVRNGNFDCTAVPAAWSSGVRQLVTCTLKAAAYPFKLGQTQSLELITRARELPTGGAGALLVNNACTGGTMPNGYVGSAIANEPTTSTGVNADKVTANDCANGDGVAVTQGVANLKVSKETRAPTAGDRVLKVTDTEMSYIITVTNTGDATAGVVVNDKIPGWSSFTKATVTNTENWACTAAETVICRSDATVMASGAVNTITIKLTHTDDVSPGFLVDSVGKVTACPNAPPVATNQPHFHCNTVGVGIDGAQPNSLGEGDWTDNYASDWVSAERYANMQTQSKSITTGATAGQAGVNSVYRVEYKNDGPSAVPGVVMRDTFKLLAGDAGFVLIDAKTAGGATCAVDSRDAGIVAVQGQGGMSYSNSDPAAVQTLTVACPAADFTAGSAQTLNITIRPNVNSGNTGRYFDNTGNFTITTGTGADYHGSDANGDFIYNSNTNVSDDTKDAQLTFKQGEADLAVQKKDVFDTFKDPIGYDGTQPAKNVLTYMLEVTNGGPSIATNAVAEDWLTPPEGKTVSFIGASAVLSHNDNDYGSTLCAVQGPSTVTGNAAKTAKLHVLCTLPGAGYGANNAPGVISSTTGQNKSYVYLRYLYETEPGASGDTVNNQVVVSSSELDPQAGNNDVTETTTLYMTADMGVVKTMVTTEPSVDPSVALPSDVGVVSIKQDFWYVLTATNHGSGQSLARNRAQANGGGGTVIVDTLPAGVVVTEPGEIRWQKIGPAFTGASPNGSGLCTLASRTITCEVGDVTFASGNLGTVRIIVPSRWDALPPGSTAPLGTSNNTAKVTTEQIDPNPVNDTTTVPLDVVNLSIAGYVFVDSNGGASDGIKQGAETGINNVTITLSGKDFNGATVTRTLTTANGGAYRFDNLPPSDEAGYTVTQSHVAGYSNGLVAPPTAGNDSATFNPGSYLAAVDSTYVAVVTPGVVANLGTIGTKGATAINYNFPKVQAVTLSGYVYADIGLNNVRDGSDPAISSATVDLLDASGNTIGTQTTNTSGYYEFTELHPGLTYSLRELLPAGYQDLPTAINPGKIGGVLCTTCSTQTVAPNTSRIDNIKLVAGSGTEFNFGEAQVASVAGVVYVDREDPTGTGLYDGNGNYDSGVDRGLGGVAIALYDATGTTLLATTTTDATSGAYGFVDFNEAAGKVVAGARYVIRQTQPAALLSGKEANGNVINTIPVPATGLLAQNFGEIAGNISGRIYLDAANDGTYSPTDADLNGVSVSLGAGTLNVFGEVVAAQQTVAGKYVFRDLPNGTYAVTEQTQPLYNTATTLNGATNAGSVSTGGTAGLATSKSVVPSAITGIAIVAGGSSPDNNFGEILPVSVAGTVFMDVNNDGAMSGAAEVGLDGVLIQLTGVDDLGQVTTTMVVPVNTANGGTFLFEGLRPGTYVLTEPNQPTGTANGITTAGTVSNIASGTATPVTTLPSAISAIDLTVPGSASIANLFGETPRDSSISGKVWLDTNDDGIVGSGENGLGGVTVTLEGTATDGTKISETVTTNPDGSYAFTGLPPGDYTITEPTQPANTVDGKTVPGSTGGTAGKQGDPASVISTITLGVTTHSVDNNFAELPSGSISGRVYNDSNDNGVIEPEEVGYANVDVVLTGVDDMGAAVNLTLKTDKNGAYSFDGLRPGTYEVTEPTQPPATLNGFTTPGSIGGQRVGTATDKATVPSKISAIKLTIGAKSIDNNFGEIGDSPDMLVSKSSSTVKFTVNNVATYTIRVRNGGQKPSFGEYIVKDRLPVGLSLAEVPAGNGWTCSGAVGDARFECRSSEVVNAGATSLSDITVKANVAAEAAQAGTVNNAVLIEGGGENEFRTPTTTERNNFEGDVSTLPVCDVAISQNACRVPNQVQLSASVGGTVWFDIGSEDTLLDGGDERLQSWVVELVDTATGAVSKSTTTAADGSYRFGDVVPGQKWNIQFRDPMSGVLWAWPVNKETAAGINVSCDADKAISGSTASACRISENGASQLQVVLEAGMHMPQQSLPVDPSGVVYDAVTRDPVPGSIVTLSPVGVCNGYDPKTAVLNAMAGGYRIEGNAISMTVGNSGYYQFMFGPAAPARCELRLTVTPPGGYQFVSSMIPAQDGSLSPAGAAGTSHLVQPQANAPTGAVGTPTQYWLTLFAGSATAGIVHNHIPLDTAEATGLVITKTGDRQTAEIGDTVQYTITVRQTAGSALATVNIVDTLPRGFTYIDGTGRVGGRAVDNPLGKPGPRLGFNLGPIDVGGQLVLTYRVRVGVGAQQGDGVNRAQAHGCSISGGCIDPVGLTPVPGSVPSNRAEYRVRVTGGVFTEEACVLGKIFVDCNNNHVQDREELGIPGVRMYFSNGTWMISDSEGKYSYCGLTPQSHTLKVDPSTLPVGARLTTSSNRNLGDADSLFLDLKNGELHRADFVEGSCSNPLLEQVKARRTQGEVRAPETETGQSQLRFDSKPARAPQQATDSSNQRPIVQPRPNPPSAAAQQEVQP